MFTNKTLSENFLQNSKKLLDISNSRGPDETGSILIENRIYLGSNRLRIIGEAELGKMPLKSNCGNYYIVFNGEIYNYKELREILKKEGFSFRTNTDTEVLLNSYICWKEEFITKLNGIFAFTIYDIKKGLMIVARDRFGCKPLYFINTKDFISLSSDFSVLDNLNSIGAREIDNQALTSLLLCRFVPGSKTIYKNINKVLPGEMIIWNTQDLSSTSKKYWSPKVKIQKFDQNIFEEKAMNAIKITSHADVEVSILLSGGLDSSIVAATLNDEKLKAFSCYFKGSVKELELDKKTLLSVGNLNETDFAKSVASKYQISYEDFELDYEINQNEFNQLQEALGEPIAVTNSLGLFLFGKKLKGKTKISLSGTGADELLGGYKDLYFTKDDGDHSNATPQELLRSLSDFDKGEVSALDYLNKDLVDSSYINDYAVNSLTQFEDESLSNEVLNQLLVFEFNFALPYWEMDMADKLFMSSSIELRPSFLENEFVDYCLSISSVDKVNKKPLRKMGEKKLPDNITYGLKIPSLSTPEIIMKQKWFKEIEDSVKKDTYNIWSNEIKKNFSSFKEKTSFDVFYRVIYFQSWLNNRSQIERINVI